MDALIYRFLNVTKIDEWMTNHGLEWLVSQRVIETISLLIGALFVYYIGSFFVSWTIKHLMFSTSKYRSWHHKDIEKRQKTLLGLFHGFWRIIIIAYVAAMVANKLFLFDLSPLFASAGIIGVALGFGAQSLVRDFLSGIFIITENQYRVGDIVDIMGAAGTVELVGTRSTVIRDNDGNVHYIPNGTIQHVINKTMGYSISRFTLQLDPSVEIAEVTEIINQTGLKLANEESWKKKIITPPKFVAVGDITGRSIELSISGKTQPSDQWAVTSEMRKRLLKEFEKRNILLAAPPTAIAASKR